ncbi:MAG: type II TA system antitoxin MqsA family protein [Actinomycetota bacterium]
MCPQEYDICPVCGARGLEVTNRPLDAGTGSRSTVIEPGFEYEHCTICGEDLIPAAHLDALTALAIAKERAEDGLLSGSEIRRLRLSLGLTQADLEGLLGVGETTVGRWERGLYAQSKPADRLLRLLAAHPELIAETGFVAAEGRGPYGRKQTSKSGA